MTKQQDPIALADACEESARAWANEIDTRLNAAAELRRLHAESLQLRADLEAVGAGGVGPLMQPANSPEIPDGWKLVPVKPTHDMQEAGIDAHYEAEKKMQEPNAWEPGGFAERKVRASHVYRAMLAAAPHPPKYEPEQWEIR